MLSPKMLKSQIHIVAGGRGGWWPNSDAESKNVKIPNSHFHRCGKGRIGSQLLMLSPKMLKSQIHIFTGGRGHQQPTFDAKFINAKILASLFCRGRVGGQLLMLSPKMLKSHIHIYSRCGKGEGWQPTFDAESRNAKIPNSHFCRWGGLAANF